MRNKASQRDSIKQSKSNEKHAEKVTLIACPICKEQSLFYDKDSNGYECLNLKCRIKGKTIEEIETKHDLITSELAFPVDSPLNSKGEVPVIPTEKVNIKNESDLGQSKPDSSRDNTSSKLKPSSKKRINKKYKTSRNTTIPYWMLPIILIFSLSIIGVSLGLLFKTYILFWTLLGTGIIYSIEKWFGSYFRNHLYVSKSYKLILNLSLFSLFGLIIWIAFSLFSKQLLQSPLFGSLWLLGELCIFIWLYKLVSKNSWRKPSLKITLLFIIALTLIFAFAGVQPFSRYKDNIIDNISGFIGEQTENINTIELPEKSGNELVVEQDTITEEDSVIDQAIDKIDDIWDTSVTDFTEKFNNYRQSKGLKPLEFIEDLNRVAALRLQELYTDYSHHSDGNYNSHLAENINRISFGNLSNSDALNSWKNSPGHNANMLDPEYKYTGYANGKGYAVQVFSEYTTINGEPQLPPGWYWVD
jgi:hypothetical protein